MKNILIAGVGGQGVVLASKAIAACALLRGETAHTAETIGMAQRGGSVVSHVRLGEGAYSPLIARGSAQLLLAFEPAEAVRMLPYLQPGGWLVSAVSPIQPASGKGYDVAAVLSYLRRYVPQCRLIDDAAILAELGEPRSLNMVLLAAAADLQMGFCYEELQQVVCEQLKPQFREQNLRALQLGRAAVMRAEDAAAAPQSVAKQQG